MSAPDFPDTPIYTNPVSIPEGDALVQTAKDDLGTVVDEVKQQTSSLGEEARVQIAEAAEKAKDLAATQKDLLVEQLGGVTGALQKVASELEGENAAGGRYVRVIADNADRMTATIRNNDIDQIISLAQDFGRKQPVAFMGAAALLGFVASRFVTASASRSPAPSAQSNPVGATGSVTGANNGRG